MFLTDFVVTLLALLGQTAEQTVGARLAGTGIGAALALIGYLAWPSWEGESAQQKLARLFETQAHYAALVLRTYVRTGRAEGTPSPAELRSAGRSARRARSDAEASADRLADEPSRPPMTARLAYALTGIARRIAHASLTLQAAVEGAQAAAGTHASGGTHSRPPGRPGTPAPPGQPGLSEGPAASGIPARPEITSRPAPTGTIEARAHSAVNGAVNSAVNGAVNGNGVASVAGAVDRFADGVEGAGRVIAGSLRSLRPPGDMPPLREWQTASYDQFSGAGQPAGPGRPGRGPDRRDRRVHRRARHRR